MQDNLESDPVPVEQTRYAVPGWGVGELWTSGAVVLAHDFRFDGIAGVDGAVGGAGARGVRARLGAQSPKAPNTLKPPKGVLAPLGNTVPLEPSKMGYSFVPNRQQRCPKEREIWPPELVERFEAFLSGDHAPFDDVELDLTWATPFQRSVAGALRNVPRGEIVTYAELALLAGHPGAARAAGSFCARNRFAFIVPCHRVVGAAGIGGYGSAGVRVKRRLLALDGVVL